MKDLHRLPGTPTAWINPNIVSAVRVVNIEDGPSIVVLHTDQGYAIELFPDGEQTAGDLLMEALEALHAIPTAPKK